MDYDNLNLISVIIGMCCFLGANIINNLISNFFDKKKKTQDILDKEIKKDVEVLISKVNEMNEKISIFNERSETLFKLVNRNTTQIDKINNEILEIHKQFKNK